MPDLVLASQSLGRKKLLQYLKIPFEIFPSTLKEEKINASTPEKTLQLRAKLKGEDVAKKLFARAALANGSATSYLILSADSGAIFDGKLIGKPHGRKEAVRILKTLAGHRHKYITSTYIIKLMLSQVEASKSIIYQGENSSFVTFRKMTEAEINFFLDRTDYRRFAAAYILVSSQDFITRVEGSLSNVIGLPLEDVIPVLKKENLL